MFCHKCGVQVSEDALFCPNCGEKLIVDEIAPKIVPQSYAVDTVRQKADQQVETKESFIKAAVAVVAVAAAIIVIAILISSGTLKDIWDTLTYLDNATEAIVSHGTLEPAMQSASDIFPGIQDTSSSSSTNTETTRTTVKGPATIDDAKEIFEEWRATHPLDSSLVVNGGYNDVDNGVIRLFLFDYEYDYEYGTIEVDKRDGSMRMIIDNYYEYDLDDWYYGRTFEDEYSWDDEYYIDGNFEWVEYPNIKTDYIYGTAITSHIEGIVRNISGSTKSPMITFILYDSNWNQIGTATDFTSHLADGTTWKFSAYWPSDAVYYEFYEIR